MTVWLLKRSYIVLLAILLSYFVPYLGWVGLFLASFLILGKPEQFVSVLAFLVVPPILQSVIMHTPILWMLVANRAFLAFATLALKKDRSWAAPLQALTIVSVIFVSLIYWLHPSIEYTWTHFWAWALNVLFGQINQMMTMLPENHALLNMISVPSASLSAQSIPLWISQISTGLWVSAYGVNDLFILFCVTQWYSRANPSQRQVFAGWKQIRLHLVLSLALALVLVAPKNLMIERYDLLLVLSIPFFIAGLGLVHWFCDTRTRAVGWLFIFYLTFTVYPVYISLLLIVLALIDSAIDVRKRVMKEVNCDENHSVRKNP